ncbi:MAG: hypothetical protein J5801_00510 [Bacteroidales bacterium]|nr:hypothetical protein [Bacteroidales bacterium]
MKRTLLVAILAVSAIAFSCTMEEPAKSDSMVFNPTATVADFVLDGATKTAFTISDNKVTFAFEDDDILRIYPLNPVGDGLRFTVKDNKGTSCVFDGGGFGLFEGLSYAAFYPGSDDVVPDATEIPVDYTGQSMMEKEAWNLCAVDYLVASIPAVEGACSFSMKHIGALMVLDVTFEEDGSYNELSLTSDGTPFITEGIVDLTADEISIEPEGTSDTITLTLGGSDGMYFEAGETVRFVMMIAPVDMSNSTITMTLTNGYDEISTEFEGKNYESGKAFKTLGSPVEEPLGDPIDLSANGTANTYIVSERGYYSIDATIAGNGARTSIDFNARPASIVYPEWTKRKGISDFTGDGVEVTLNQNDCVSNVSYEDGKILFKATGREGNAKLTLTYGGECVWTWVIWCTDAPATLPFTIDGNTYNIMDRNLGALSNGSVLPTSIEEVCGLSYQFGNPLGYTWEEFENGIYTKRLGYEYPDYPDKATLKSALADNPNRPNLNCHATDPSDPSHGGDYHWVYVYDFSAYAELLGKFWGGGSYASEDQTTGANRLKRGYESSKTYFDPCPVGYKVMGWDTFVNYTAVTSGNVFGVYVPVDGGANLFIPYNGHAWSTAFGRYQAVRGPAPVTIDGLAGPFATLWTSGHNGKNMGFCFAWKYDQTTGSGSSTFEYLDKNDLFDVASSIVARGLGVRCIAE